MEPVKSSPQHIKIYNYRERLEPRFQAWLVLREADRSSEPKRSILSRVPFVHKTKKVTVSSSPVVALSELMFLISTQHSDIKKLILSKLSEKNAPVELQRMMRAVSKKYRDTIDRATFYWKKVELEMLKREIPAAVQEIFGGAKRIQRLPYVDFNKIYSEEFQKTGVYHPEFQLPFIINWISENKFSSSIARSIAPNGSYYFALKVQIGQSLREVWVLQESQPAFLCPVKKKSIGWVFNNKNINYPSSNLVVIRPNEERVEKELIQDLKTLIQTGTYDRVIPFSMCSGTLKISLIGKAN